MSDPKSVQKTINDKELETLAFWQENKIFEKTVETPAGQAPKGDFSFYDGPPFATGVPHHGHILAGTIKDAIPRFQTMNGYRVRRVWGWDCHGLPIENLIEKKLGLKSKKDIEDFGIDKFNKDAQDSVLQYESEWKKIIPRLGRFVDMDNDYKTMDATYTESIWWAWKTLAEKGLAYEGHKMMHICPRCETTLAQSEVGMEYHDITDLTVTAKFELVDEPNTFVLAWTTTPWTLPGNTALAVNKNIEYVKVSIEGMEGKYILAKKRVDEILKEMKYEVVDTFVGDDLIGKSYKPVFQYFKDEKLDNKENIYKIWHADFITEEDGTGIAHEAPAFGAEDMELAKANKIPVIIHVKMDGTFIPQVSDFAGMKVKTAEDNQSADVEIIKYLAHTGLLFEKHKVIHSYPLCWRCSTPLLNYATSSWFMDVPKIKSKILSENQKIGWTPEHIRDGRFGKWKEGEHEWAVSRTRYWGAPLPVWKNEKGDTVFIGSLKELAEKNKQKVKNTYYVMRHGEAESNVRGIIDCDGDETNGLTEKGKEQSREAIKKIDNKIDLIFCSPFLRAKETAEEIRKELGDVEVIFDDRLKESQLGSYDKKTIDEYVKDNSKVKLDTVIGGGESHRDIINRTLSFWNEIEKKYEGKNILIVTHGGPAWMLAKSISLTTDSEIEKEMEHLGAGSWLPNAEVVKLEPLLVPRDETGKINLHRPYIDEVELEIEGVTYKRIPDVFDCWYESGSMPFASIHYPFENKDIFEKQFPADFIAEGLDQTRGWFSSLMNLGVGLFDKSPYENVIVNGLVMATGGQKMSKSQKNYTDPMELVEKFGADAIRYFLLSSPVVKGESVSFSDESVEEVYKKIIMRLENVLSLYEMNKIDTDKSDIGKTVLDEWIISRLNEVIKSATSGYSNYKLDEATRPIDQFVDDLSVWYVRRSRDRLKGDRGEEEKKRSAATLKYVLLEFAKSIAPIMPFTAERVYKQVGGEKESVHLESWPNGGDINESLIKDMKRVRDIVSLGLMKRTESKINVKQPLLSISIKQEVDKKYFDLIEDELNIKEVKVNPSQEVDVTLDTTINEELQREGDIRKLIRAVQDARKEKGLLPQDTISLKVSSLDILGDVSLLKNTCKVSEIKEDKDIVGGSVELSSGVIHFTLV